MSADRDRTTVTVLKAEGLIRLDTPEGQAIALSRARAQELISSAELQRRIRRGLHELPIDYTVVSPESES